MIARRAAHPVYAGAALLACWPGLAAAAEPGDLHVAWWRVAAGFCVSVALALGAIYLVWTRQQGRSVQGPMVSLSGAWRMLQPPSRRMRLVESLRLNNHVNLCLIHYEGTEYAVAAGPQGGSLVFERPKPSGSAKAGAVDAQAS